MTEVEVFRLTPEVGKCYQYAEATREEEDENLRTRYFTTNRLEFVGICRSNEGNNYYFSPDVEGTIDQDKELRVIGKSKNPFFREVHCIDEFKHVLRSIQNTPKTLGQLARNALSTNDIAVARENDILPPPGKLPKLKRGGKSRRYSRSRSRGGKKRTLKK